MAPYTGAETDSELPVLLQYLDRLRTAENVRVVEKRAWRSGVTAQGETDEDQCA